MHAWPFLAFKMRTFLGVAIPVSAQTTLKELQESFKINGSGIRWVPPGKMHVTLKFLGDTTEFQREALVERLRDIARQQAPFAASLQEALGGFPSIQQPRVLWVGLEQGAMPLAALALRLEEESRRLGFKLEEHPFHPHVTLARIEAPILSRHIGEAAREIKWVVPPPWPVKALTFYSSQSGSETVRYDVLGDFSFTGKVLSK